MNVEDELARILRNQYISLEVWFKRWLPAEQAALLTRESLCGLLQDALTGVAPRNGPYCALYSHAADQLQMREPYVLHRLGVRWRREIPLPARGGQDLVNAYCMAYAAASLMKISSWEAMVLARVPSYLDSEGKVKHVDEPKEGGFTEYLLHGGHVIRPFLAHATRAQLIRHGDTWNLRQLLNYRHYAWVTRQLMAREEAEHGNHQQDHHPSHPHVQGSERQRHHHGEVGQDLPRRTDHPLEGSDPHCPDLA